MFGSSFLCFAGRGQGETGQVRGTGLQYKQNQEPCYSRLHSIKTKKMRNAPWDIDYKIKFDLCHQQHHGTVHQGLIECPKSATMF